MAIYQSITANQIKIRNLLRNAYAYMAGGLLITAFVALLVSSSTSIMQTIARNPMLLFGAIIVEFGLVFYLSARIMQMSAQRAAGLFILYSALNGFVLSMVFLMYTGQSIFTVFLVSAGAFGGMSLYAVTTKKDLTGMGKYLVMGLWGIIIASLLQMFIPGMTRFSMMISLVALILFMALTAYDTQIIRKWGTEYGSTISDEDYKRLSIIGALKLYLDFINIFLILLRFMGVSRR